jgi:peptide/nickel transport system substrate-binding protein
MPSMPRLSNFDEISLDYYREANGQFEAFKRGLYDFRVETEPLRWHDGYDFPAARNGEVIREAIRTGLPLEWINRNYFFGLYARAAGFYAGSELSAYGRAADDRERELLKPFASHMPADILEGSYHLPVSDGSGRDRATLRGALNLLAQAGYDLDDTVLRQHSTRAPFTFDILVTTRDQERIALAFARDIKRAGIEASVRAVDAVQFEQRRLGFDFDMIWNRWDQSLSPGNEQYFYWGSEAADNQGTRNYMGAKDPAIDAMIATMLDTRQRPDFVSAVRALDRTLISGFYAIPVFNIQEQWIARWNRIERPAATALTGYLPETWWQRPGAPPPDPQPK